ncbi:hypothetical protein ACFW16_09580 [Inquilinus sp. NPDC058860]|uniref:hypothetical protein n=1 Tax=Inquilinus sp. NPDC058860 TaxID=3346652 RepID=UPI0036B9E423
MKPPTIYGLDGSDFAKGSAGDDMTMAELAHQDDAPAVLQLRVSLWIFEIDRHPG